MLTLIEQERLSLWKREYMRCSELEIEIRELRRWEFVRWLVATGRLHDGEG